MGFLEKDVVNKDGKVDDEDKQPRKENQAREYCNGKLSKAFT